MKRGLVAIVALSILLSLPSVLIVEVDAKMLPLYNPDYTRGQITTMLLMPVGLTGALALMLGLAKMN